LNSGNFELLVLFVELQLTFIYSGSVKSLCLWNEIM